MTGKTTQLRACPFCGYPAVIRLHGNHSDVWRVDCLSCGASSPPWNDKEAIKRQWNQRPEITEADIAKCARAIHYSIGFWGEYGDGERSKQQCDSAARACLHAYLEG